MSFSWRSFFYCSQFCWVFPPNHLFNSIYKVNLYKCEFKQRSIKLNCCNGEHTHEENSLVVDRNPSQLWWSSWLLKRQIRKKRERWVEIIQFSLLASISVFHVLSHSSTRYFAIIFNKHFWFHWNHFNLIKLFFSIDHWKRREEWLEGEKYLSCKMSSGLMKIKLFKSWKLMKFIL